MPEKDPMNWVAGWAALPDPIRAAIVGVIVAALRVMYDGGASPWRRRLLECALSGAIALSVSSLLAAIGLSGEFGVAIGGAVGLLGVDQVRAWAKRIGERRVRDLEGDA